MQQRSPHGVEPDGIGQPPHAEGRRREAPDILGRLLVDLALPQARYLPPRLRQRGLVNPAVEAAEHQPALKLALALAPIPPMPLTGSTPRPPAIQMGRFLVGGIPAWARGAEDGGERADQPEAPIPFDPTTPSRAPPPAPARSPATKTESGLPDLSGEQWGMAPIRWWGSTSTSGNAFLDGAGSRNLSVANALSVQAGSFIVAPYIAQWSGNFGLSSNTGSYSSPIAAAIKSESGSRSIGGTLLALPLSQYPFSANFNYANGESKASGTNTPSSSSGIGLRQQFRTLDGRDNYTASYNRNSFTSGQVTSQTSSMQGSGTGRRVFGADHLLEGEHLFSATAGFTPASSGAVGQQARLLNGTASHAWTVHEDLNFSTQVAVANTRADQFLGNALVASDSTVIAGATNASWRPFEDEPLNLSGGLSASRSVTRGQQTGTATGGPVVPKDVEITSVGGNVAANYRFSDNLFASGNTSVTATSASGRRFSGVAAGANLGYSGNPLRFGEFAYAWGLNSGVTAASFSSQPATVGVNAGANHSLNRNFVVDERQSINLSGGQGLSVTYSGGSNTAALSNNLGLSWRANYGSALTASIGANAGYSVSTAVSGMNQLISGSLMGSAAYQISSRAAVTLNTNLNASRSLIPGVGTQTLDQVVFDSRQQQVNGSIALGYTHTAPFSIRNLNYTANALWIANQVGQRIESTAGVVAPQTQQSASLNQMIDYRVGRLTFRLNAAVASQQGGKATTSVFGSVTRDFDGFFDGRW